MELFLTHNKPSGITIDLCKLNGEVFDMLTITGPKEQIDYWIENFAPVYQLLFDENLDSAGSDIFRKTAFVHKSRSADLEKTLFILFRGGSAVAYN
ncbi:hypothetical protein [Spirosoma sp. 48-14]|uniref:hypothetical protein n=1 Tax=Spirosoma sp. 48-14 TaxID=1895854 RepID=UPI0009606A73|nr:hypothetical protein [Spirosoma sp. 48-14]OJW75396.1 MAG: hypothetical protein BGO59_19910 [Spirosoma sp. 48-14]